MPVDSCAEASLQVSHVCSHSLLKAFVFRMCHRDAAEKAAKELYGKLIVKGVRLRLSWGKPQQVCVLCARKCIMVAFVRVRMSTQRDSSRGKLEGCKWTPKI